MSHLADIGEMVAKSQDAADEADVRAVQLAVDRLVRSARRKWDVAEKARAAAQEEQEQLDRVGAPAAYAKTSYAVSSDATVVEFYDVTGALITSVEISGLAQKQPAADLSSCISQRLEETKAAYGGILGMNQPYKHLTARKHP